MEANLGLMGTAGVGVGVPSGGSGSTVSKEENLVLSPEVSSSYPDEAELELGLGLSLGGGVKSKAASWRQYARILTAKDVPAMVSKSSSSSSSSNAAKPNGSCGTKRAADSVSPPRSGIRNSQVVGWPPLRTYRMNSLVNQAKSQMTEEFSSTTEISKSKSFIVNKTDGCSNKNNEAKEKMQLKTTLFVKVNMDGIPIGRKVDLNAYRGYKALVKTLDDMFFGSSATVCARRSKIEDQGVNTEATRPLRLLDGSSEFVLTYEDKEGDWMLVGDVPWEMFLGSVKRLRIMRTSEANGLAPEFQERSGRQRTKPI